MNPTLLTAVKWWRRLLDIAAALLLAAVTGITFARVLGRYVFGAGLPWSEELVRLLFVWLILLGAARTSHLQIDVLLNNFTDRTRRIFGVAVAMISIVLLAVLIWNDLPLIELTSGDYYTALGVSLSYLYYSVVVGGAFWIASIVIALFVPEEAEDQSAS